MDDLLSEKEQIDQMRVWWSEYGSYVIGGVVLGAAILFGWNYVQKTERDAKYAASALYDDLANVVVDANVEEAEAIAGQLAVDYPDSNYAAQARFALARLYMDENRDQDSADILREVIASNTSDEFKKIAEIRLAKILLYQDKADEVVALLADTEEGAFAARAAEIMGDAYVVMGQTANAREAYQRALAESGNAATVNQQFVQFKLLDLPVETIVDLVPELPDVVAEEDDVAIEEDDVATEEDDVVTEEEAE